MRFLALPLLILSLFSSVLAFAPASFAQDQGTTGGNIEGTLGTTGKNAGITLLNPLGNNASLESLLNSILDFVIKIGTVVIVLMMVYIGFLFVTAQGDPGRIGEARAAFFWTIVGALVLLGAKAIALGVKATVEALK